MTFILPSIGGGVIASPTAPPAPAFSNTYSVDFDGTNDYMNASGTELDLKSNFSTSGWYYSTDYSQVVFAWAWGENTTGKRRSLILINGVWYFNFHGSPSATTTSTLSNNTWYHVATTVNSDYSEAKIYLNGTLENTVDVSSLAVAYSSYGSTTLGGKPGVSHFDGLIDEFAIFNSVLSASDVTSIYNSGTPADLSSYSPVGWWRMGDNDSGTGTTITDQGSGGNDGTLTNGPTFSTTVP